MVGERHVPGLVLQGIDRGMDLRPDFRRLAQELVLALRSFGISVDDNAFLGIREQVFEEEIDVILARDERGHVALVKMS